MTGPAAGELGRWKVCSPRSEPGLKSPNLILALFAPAPALRVLVVIGGRECQESQNASFR